MIEPLLFLIAGSLWLIWLCMIGGIVTALDRIAEVMEKIAKERE